MQLDESVRGRVAAMLDRARVPGCSLGVRRGGKTATAQFGLADISTQRPVDEATVFHLFSGTKLYTAAAVMLLRERGLLELDQRVADHLPELDLEHPITVRHLLSHSSGLPDTLSAFFSVHFEGMAPPSSGVALSRFRTDRGKQPSRKAVYRNVNYAILGELITRLSGVPYVDFVEREVVQPLARPSHG